jgi:hypothetical protein
MSLHRIEQVTTYSAPTKATMRGRLFGACTAIPVFLDDGSLNPLALAVLDAAFNRGLIV